MYTVHECSIELKWLQFRISFFVQYNRFETTSLAPLLVGTSYKASPDLESATLRCTVVVNAGRSPRQ
ncbi:unnamed protein product [Calypogeia fissa]